MKFMEIISLEIGHGLIPLTEEENGTLLRNKIKDIRKQLKDELKLNLPKICIRDNSTLELYEYRIKINENEIGRGNFKKSIFSTAFIIIFNHLYESIHRHISDIFEENGH